MSAWRPTEVLAAALRRGAPTRRTVERAIGVGALAQLAGVALVGGATALLTWSASRPGLGAVAGLLVAVEVVAFLRAPLRHAERVSAHDLGLGGLSGWRTWLLDGVSTWSPSELGAARSGDLLARCLGDADRLQDLWVRVLVPACSSLVALVVASVLLAFAVPVAGLAVLVASLVVSAATWLWSDAVARLGIAEADLRGTVAARVVELAHGAESLTLLGAATHHEATTLALVRRCDEMAARRRSIVAALGVIAALCAAGAIVAAAGAVQIPTSSPARAAGVLVAVLACGELLAAIPSALESLGTVAGAAARLGTLQHPVRTGTTGSSRGPLWFDHVDVAATSDAAVLLHDVTLTVPFGGTVSVVGPTGAGKSSLLAVAARLEPPRAGRVSLAGVDVDELDEPSLRARVGWLPTHPGLLDGRVRDVLDLGRGHSDDSLLAALERVGLGATLERRGGLEAVIGARGDGLSAGELRRLALARLLAGEPDLYLLDEPTAGLDEASTALVLSALDATGAGVLVATHDSRVESWATTTRTIRDGALP